MQQYKGCHLICITKEDTVDFSTTNRVQMTQKWWKLYISSKPTAVPKPNFLKVEKVKQEVFCVKFKKIRNAFFYDYIFKVIGSDLWPLLSELINLAQPPKRTLHKLHFYIRSVCVSVAEKKIRSVLCGQVQQKYMKNPVFGGL